eukprot:TRINITY_DN3379_c0_g1_i2.p1 TRINITY_DN3379_c0_g1~~TRINITY_DN3379_c0_g1_i2.p1  ORF type:complete len:203 (+),score=43.06 TRINITY_DN3379_c0_g1_i2:111-719(+)
MPRFFTPHDRFHLHAMAGSLMLLHSVVSGYYVFTQAGLLYIRDATFIEAFVFPTLVYGFLALSSFQFKVPSAISGSAIKSDLTSGTRRFMLRHTAVGWTIVRCCTWYPQPLKSLDVLFALVFVSTLWRYPVQKTSDNWVDVLNSTWFLDCMVFYLALALIPVSYTHLRAHETVLDLVCRLLLEKKKKKIRKKILEKIKYVTK